MTSMNETQRRRRNRRHELNKEVFVALRPDFNRLGSLRDISRTGLGFEYFPCEDASCRLGDVHVDIFCQENNYLLSRLPCKLIYDQPVDPNLSSSPRRCGLQFASLSNHEMEQISLLMQNHAVGPQSNSGD
jgi:hypothetical protein